jgi:hypothetical protein
MIGEYALEVPVSGREGGPNLLPRGGKPVFRECDDAVENEFHTGPLVHDGSLARQVGPEYHPPRVGEKSVWSPRHA